VSAKTEIAGFKITKNWSGRQEGPHDRRRHRRFATTPTDAAVALVRRTGAALEVDRCRLCNVSYGGMCLSVLQKLREDAEYPFLIGLGAPFHDLVLVKARVLWSAPEEAGGVRLGVEFVESSKGWLGPDEERFE
jgi:hypothetical protein